MMKVGLIGEGTHKSLLRQYPLNLERVLLVKENGIQETLQGNTLNDWIQRGESDNEIDTQASGAVLSQLLQAVKSCDDIVVSIAQVPVYPPETAMKALGTALEWMAEHIEPDFLHIGFSSPDGRYQKLQNSWLAKLHENGCQVICPAGIPPAFPASLHHTISVADRGFIDAGFEFSNPTVVVEERETAVCLGSTWVKQAVSNEVASAMVLGQMLGDELAELPDKNTNLVQLPSLDDIEWPAFLTDTVEEEPPYSPGSFQRGKSFLKSILSRIITPKGKVPAFVKETRKVSCNGDGAMIRACDFRKASRTKGAFVCGACGCGDRESVFVDGPVPGFEKLDYPYVSCPASMPGFSNYLSSVEESQPSERKLSIEAKFGEQTLKKGQEVQEKISQRLDKRLGWLDRF